MVFMIFDIYLFEGVLLLFNNSNFISYIVNVNKIMNKGFI